MVKAVIEIPKGDTIRRYFNKSENRFVEIGQIIDIVPINNGIMPINYGFTPEAHNPNDNNALDILVISTNTLTVGQELEVNPIAVLKRADGDDKIVASDNSLEITSWDNLEEELKKLLISFFGYKSKIIEIGSKDDAEKFIEHLKSQ